ncbi:MAG: hypothetical protein V4510_03875 [bacterium]
MGAGLLILALVLLLLLGPLLFLNLVAGVLKIALIVLVVFLLLGLLAGGLRGRQSRRA